MSGQFEFVPGHVHRCRPPDTGGSAASSRLAIGTVWKCLDHDEHRGEICGKRWRVAYIDSAFGGDLDWVRRRLPWRPRFGVERMPVQSVDSTSAKRLPTGRGPTSPTGGSKD